MNQPMALTRTRTRVPAEQGSLPGETGKQAPEVGGGVGAMRARVKNGRLVVTAGRQLLSPIQYHSFEVAAVELSIDLEPGDDVEVIAAEALGVLRGIQNEEFQHALAMHKRLALEAEKSVKK